MMQRQLHTNKVRLIQELNTHDVEDNTQLHAAAKTTRGFIVIQDAEESLYNFSQIQKLPNVYAP